jgi:hypothetical protein
LKKQKRTRGPNLNEACPPVRREKSQTFKRELKVDRGLDTDSNKFEVKVALSYPFP